MSWIRKEQLSPFDTAPITGLWFLDGDMVAEYVDKPYTRGHKLPLITFPSGQEHQIWASSSSEAMAIVHLFGEMDLPLKADLDEVQATAESIAAQCGYHVSRVGERQLKLVGHDRDESLLVSYDPETQLMVNVEQLQGEIASPAMALITDELRERLPRLCENEELGLEALAQVKYFTPDSSWSWYASEFDGEDIFFGLVVGLEIELGFFSLSELQQARGPWGLPIERDLYFEPKSLLELKAMHEKWHHSGQGGQ